MNAAMKATMLTIAKKSAMSATLPLPASTQRERGRAGRQQIVNRAGSPLNGSTPDGMPKVTTIEI
jgi:hypothetical protein